MALTEERPLALTTGDEVTVDFEPLSVFRRPGFPMAAVVVPLPKCGRRGTNVWIAIPQAGVDSQE